MAAKAGIIHQALASGWPLILCLLGCQPYVTTAHCESWEFHCLNGECVRSVYICDGRTECNDGSDEFGCPDNSVTQHTWYRCEPWQFSCWNGECVHNIYICNGRNECNDGSDEFNCPNMGAPYTSTKKYTLAPCSDDYFQCQNGRCIPPDRHCDGIDDCGDASDEINCPIEDPTLPMTVSVSAIIGIVVALSALLVLTAIGGAIVYYQRRKNSPQRHRRNPREFIGPVGSLPYDLPPEAMMRVPPPRYTSQDALAIVNPGYRDDEPTHRPPPYYASHLDMSRLSLYDSMEPPPVYTSRVDLRDGEELTLAGNERQGGLNVTTVSSGILNESIASALTLNNTLISGPETSAVHQHQQQGQALERSESSRSKRSNKAPPPRKEAYDVDKMSKRLSMSSSALMDPRIIESMEFTSLDVVRDHSKPRSHSIQIDATQGTLIEKPNMSAPPVHHREKVGRHCDASTKADFRHSKHIAKSSPCLDFKDNITKEAQTANIANLNHNNAASPEPSRRRNKSSRSSPSKSKKPRKSSPTKTNVSPPGGDVPKDIRITATPDLSQWRAQILACSSQDPIQLSVQELEDIPELDDSFPESRGSRGSRGDTSMHMDRAQTEHASHGAGPFDTGQTSFSRPSSFRSKPGTSRLKSVSLPQLYRPGQPMSLKLGSTLSLEKSEC